MATVSRNVGPVQIFTAYPFRSELTARVFALLARALRDMNAPRDRMLADRYERASDYLRGRIGRDTGGLIEWKALSDYTADDRW